MKADRLAEIRTREGGGCVGYPARATADIICLLDRITALEALVPDADLLMKLLKDDYTTAEMKRVVELSAAIKAYREGE